MMRNPVPPPKIIHKVRRIEDQCSVNLNCSVPSKTPSFSLTWKYREGNSEYQTISNAENKIEETFPLDHQDIGFVCLVRNPADQKNNSVQIKHCGVVEEGKMRNPLPKIISFVFVVAVFGVMLWKSAKKTGQGMTTYRCLDEIKCRRIRTHGQHMHVQCGYKTPGPL
ncbi:unnamed protein product [Ranitomeya imitator]|uniref:Ig-like domain-containing protein n=1 Tax=Ranitomeya imitator TaxID=111125 RepID=A0ABN9LV76_9NEOB|nr:unnamed protein product [Ranitomeya imitator]